MWSKLYLAVLGLSIAVMAFFTYYSWSWLQSIGLPAAAIDGYHYHSKFALVSLGLSSVALLLLGNVNLWLTRNSWAMWTTLLYFAVFILIRYFWLIPSLLDFERTSRPGQEDIWFRPLFGLVIILGGAVAVFFDQFVVVRLQRKMYPLTVADDLETESESRTDLTSAEKSRGSK